jgi:hypothetical protein
MLLNLRDNDFTAYTFTGHMNFSVRGFFTTPEPTIPLLVQANVSRSANWLEGGM